MTTQDRDEDSGRYSEKMRDQDLLKAFDYEATVDDPHLTVREITDALAEHFDIDVTTEAVRARLERMCDGETVAKRDFGGAVAYRALVGPELSDEVKEELAEREETPTDEYIEL
jgi:hypothetical protein